MELVSDYEVNTFIIRKDLCTMKHLYNIPNGGTASPYLLSKKSIYVPQGAKRLRNLFLPPRVRTNTSSNSPITKMMAIYNKAMKINRKIDILIFRYEISI